MAEMYLYEAFSKWKGFAPKSITLLPVSGSHRKYYRLRFDEQSCLGVFNSDIAENTAYIDFSSQFAKKGLAIPEILHQTEDPRIYFVEDLGNTTLYQCLCDLRGNGDFPEAILPYYDKALDDLLRFQFEGGENMDYSFAYPRKAFDAQSMRWDLNYFKYYFLRLGDIPFDEEALENDFSKFVDILSEAEGNYFMFRDFQSRNIMLKQNQLYFIDFQGGRKGPLAYDLASLLFDAKADIPHKQKEKLLNRYIDKLQAYRNTDAKKFKQQFYAFVYIRIMQAMGTYGLRGFYEKKEHFLKSIPFAIENLSYLNDINGLPQGLSEIKKVFDFLIKSHWRHFLLSTPLASSLQLSISSFSFKKGYPADLYGNGGGFIFDCRALPNPGREEKYKTLTGKDKEVIDYLEKHHEVEAFVQAAVEMIKPSILNYTERNFTHLSIGFGCTGGQHRSVYCAENFAKKIQSIYPLSVCLSHREQEL